MITITTNNSISYIRGLTIQQFKELRKALSYRIPAHQARYMGGHKSVDRPLMNKRGEFPTGLLYMATKYLKNKRLKYQVLENRVLPRMPVAPVLKASLAHTPYPEQQEAAEACLRRYRGIVVAPTGVGKSMIVVLIIEKLQTPTFVVVPSLELKNQLTETLKQAFGEEKVGPGKFICVENVDACSKADFKPYHCVIVDEYHHSAAKTYRNLNKKHWGHIFYRFGLTATPFRSQDHEKILLESILSQVIYRVDFHAAVESGYICPLEAYYVDLPKRQVKGDTWQQVYKELIVDNSARNEIIIGLMALLTNSKKSCLTLVKEINHGKILSAEGSFLFVNGEDEETRDYITWFNEKKISVLIGTTGVVGEGVDTKPAEYIIIAGLGKAKTSFMQQVGRGFRRFEDKESCKVILFRDPSHKWTLAHFREQCKTLKEEYAVIPVKLEI